MANASVTKERSTAAKRREEIVEAAMIEFGKGGLHGTSTESIARRVGVSQPYLFRLFGTKKQLFIACLERGFGRTLAALGDAAAAAAPGARLEAMGDAYAQLLADRQLLLCQMQVYVAACDDAEIAAAGRRHFGEIVELIDRVAREEVPAGEVQQTVCDFTAHGMLMNVAAALDLPSVAGREPWVARLLGDFIEKVPPARGKRR